MFNEAATGDLHLGYIEQYWEVFAGVSWKEYIAQGRGALVFTPSEEDEGEWDFIFMPLGSLRCGPSSMAEYAGLVERYDPMNQIVVVFLTPPDIVSAYCGGLTPEGIAPPEAYTKLAGVLNRN